MGNCSSSSPRAHKKVMPAPIATAWVNYIEISTPVEGASTPGPITPSTANTPPTRGSLGTAPGPRPARTSTHNSVGAIPPDAVIAPRGSTGTTSRFGNGFSKRFSAPGQPLRVVVTNDPSGPSGKEKKVKTADGAFAREASRARFAALVDGSPRGSPNTVDLSHRSRRASYRPVLMGAEAEAFAAGMAAGGGGHGLDASMMIKVLDRHEKSKRGN